MELIGGRKRTVLGVAYEYPFSFGFVSLAGIAYFLTDWRYLQLAISAPIVLLLVYYW
jgi:OCT family organic cation transporter-like MFS transporter 4/5